MKKIFLIISIAVIFLNEICAQTFNVKVYRAIILDGDTVPIMDLTPVEIKSRRTFANNREAARFNKLVRDVKKVYPYAKLADIKMKEYNAIMNSNLSDSEKARLMKVAENQLKAQFENDIENMTFTQGKILIKLIDRQTGNTSYEIVKELRGSLTAFFWQSFARVFGMNLKAEYDSTGDDKYIEEIIKMIESGNI